MAARVGFEDQRQRQQYPNWAGKMLTKIKETAKVQTSKRRRFSGTPQGQEKKNEQSQYSPDSWDKGV